MHGNVEIHEVEFWVFQKQQYIWQNVRKKEKMKEHELLGIRIELTNQIEKFEMRIVKKVAES
ncbi:hypothetical protein V6946_03360 [Bacillus sp. PPSBB_2]|uniref:hypothetical protein n=1 Tax=Bacillus sp. PPSBB_2 TaxID=3123319 RepID=UPI00324F9100